MAEKKVYLGTMGPYLIDDSDALDDPDGDFSGQAQVGMVTNSQIVATEFIGVPVSSISVSNIDDPSAELNLLSASTVGGLIAVYEASAGANDEFTMYLWDTNAAAENVPYTVDGNGGVWIAVSGKYQNGSAKFSGGATSTHDVVSSLQAGGGGAVGFQYKTRTITVTNGLVTNVSSESSWSDI